MIGLHERSAGIWRSICQAGLALGVILAAPGMVHAAEPGGGMSLLSSISISILVATVLAYLGTLIKQPLILAYLAAGVVVGPQMGFGWVRSKSDIEIIAEIGLILLLFMIGLELDLRKLRKSGKALVIPGIFQFVLCVTLGLGFFFLMGFTWKGAAPFRYEILGVKILGGPYDLLYLAACLAISSTTIVVKLLYEKFELDTLAGRITLGILVFQDLWAIVLLGLQSSLANPRILLIAWDFAKGALLVLVSLLLSKYLLKLIFQRIAKLSELVLVASLGWCFLIAGLADRLGLSMEMGALIAGVAISTFPYNLDIIGKIVNIRDFFITLFFVALGMVLPNPLNHPGLLAIAVLASLFLVSSRFLSIFPLLYGLKQGNRVSLLASINLSQISEFALVIAVIGMKPENGHIGPDIRTIIIFVFVLTAITSTYMIKYSHGLQNFLGRGVKKIGFNPLREQQPDDLPEHPKDIALLGFFRVASSFVAEMQAWKPEWHDKLVVVDFNPQVYTGLQARGIKVVYGDISNLATLHHAGIAEAKVVISTITDDILVGTDNLKLISQIRSLCPQARIVVTASNPSQALELYHAGADYVLRPNYLTALHLLPVVENLLHGDAALLKEEALQELAQRQEVLE